MATDATQPAGASWVGEWLELLLNHASDYAAVLTDPQGMILAWLNGAENVFGYTRAEVLGRHIDIIFSPEDRRSGVAAHELATAREVGRAQDDRWHARKDGSLFWGSGEAIAVREPGGTLLGFGKLVRDRTDLRTQVEALKNRLQAETDLRRGQDLMLATLAHELRNPLAPLRTAVSLLHGLGDARFATALQIVDRQVAALQRLVDDMMDAAQLKAGKLRLAIQRVSLQHELATALSSVEAQARSKGVDLRPVLPAFEISIDVDRDRFQQVVVNLLINAIKFTSSGGTVWLKASVDSGHAVVRIEDTGSGIAPELQPKIFQLFTQGPAAPPGRGGGLGLGLTLVKDLMTLHNGTVAVRSEGIGKGSEFTLRLPLVQKTSASLPDAA
ncbi:PAS domain-containing sensor histidine kinase [Ideonella sp.]|uniref:PAS domain-containing sensor histidine kinase n=1 Tax=Ideonella sp. TaxID=1929293 RepID=UPI002B4798D9|nr:PAS domain-containing sensor histidine kinase [Ideonella sp.]HJV70562.1 PAS domain-containing sensor histidine kinase [Ideonella sp.]